MSEFAETATAVSASPRLTRTSACGSRWARVVGDSALRLRQPLVAMKPTPSAAGNRQSRGHVAHRYQLPDDTDSDVALSGLSINSSISMSGPT
jgi:hypothetical protein